MTPSADLPPKRVAPKIAKTYYDFHCNQQVAEKDAIWGVFHWVDERVFSKKNHHTTRNQHKAYQENI